MDYEIPVCSADVLIWKDYNQVNLDLPMHHKSVIYSIIPIIPLM